MEKVTLNVQGMSCGHCVKSIEGSVGDLTGVTKVKVHLHSGTVDVEFNSKEVSIGSIEEIIEDQGYDIK